MPADAESNARSLCVSASLAFALPVSCTLSESKREPESCPFAVCVPDSTAFCEPRPQSVCLAGR
jgi:hypothetical protein